MMNHDRPIEEGAPGIAVVMQQMPALINAMERALLDAYLAGVDAQKLWAAEENDKVSREFIERDVLERAAKVAEETTAKAAEEAKDSKAGPEYWALKGLAAKLRSMTPLQQAIAAPEQEEEKS